MCNCLKIDVIDECDTDNVFMGVGGQIITLRGQYMLVYAI